MLIVAKDGSGDFVSVSAALTYLESVGGGTGGFSAGAAGDCPKADEKRRIFIRSGVYEERVEIRIPQVSLVGEDREKTRISQGLFAMMPMADIGRLGTFRTYTMLVAARDVSIRNLTIENTAGAGPRIGQAIALYADGDRFLAENCAVVGWTDTLFTGPLPPKERLKNGFVGPGQFAARINTRQLYKNCRIEGDVDFIFGSATAFFEECEIRSKDRSLQAGSALPRDRKVIRDQEISMNRIRPAGGDPPVKGYVTAASTAEGQPYGYVFSRCRFTGEVPPGSVYLGRPWRNFAKTVILNSFLGPHIRAGGWHNWGSAAAEKTVFYAEHGNCGDGADLAGRPSWIKRLTDEEAAQYTRQRVLGPADGRF